MCLIVVGPGGNHCCNQMVAGFFFGLSVGYCESVGLFGLAHTISVLLFVLTLLDHCGTVIVPWGYHGPGFEPNRFRGGITLQQLVWEIIAFHINNCCLYVSFIFWYAVFSGHVEVRHYRTYMEALKL